MVAVQETECYTRPGSYHLVSSTNNSDPVNKYLLTKKTNSSFLMRENHINLKNKFPEEHFSLLIITLLIVTIIMTLQT